MLETILKLLTAELFKCGACNNKSVILSNNKMLSNVSF